MNKTVTPSTNVKAGGYMFKKIMILMMVLLVGLGCEGGDLNLAVMFDQIEGLKANDRVIFETNPIGSVDEITYTKDGNYRVRLMIEKAFRNAVTEHARFFIDPDPQNTERKAVKMIQVRDGGQPFQNNAVVEGSGKSSAIFERLEKDIEQGIGDFQKQYDKFAEELKRVPESEAYKELEKTLGDLYDQMKQSGKDVREKIQKDILPRLEKELEDLKKRLQDSGKDDELKPLEIQMEELRKI